MNSDYLHLRHASKNTYDHVDMICISILRCITSQDGMHLEIINYHLYHLKMHIILRWHSFIDIYLEMVCISRWYASRDDMHLEMICISRWHASRDDLHLEIMCISRCTSSQNDMHICSAS